MDQDRIYLSVNGIKVNPVLKQINGNNRDYWIIYYPTKEFEFNQIVNIKIDYDNIYESVMNPYEYGFRIESLAEYNIAQENTPSFKIDESDPIQHKVIADSGTEIKGAKIIYDPFEPVKPRFGPLKKLPNLVGTNAIAVGCPLSLEPPTVFNNPVTVFVPCEESEIVTSVGSGGCFINVLI